MDFLYILVAKIELFFKYNNIFVHFLLVVELNKNRIPPRIFY